VSQFLDGLMNERLTRSVSDNVVMESNRTDVFEETQRSAGGRS
jgi:hypothetical protein